MATITDRVRTLRKEMEGLAEQMTKVHELDSDLTTQVASSKPMQEPEPWQGGQPWPPVPYYGRGGPPVPYGGRGGTLEGMSRSMGTGGGGGGGSRTGGGNIGGATVSMSRGTGGDGRLTFTSPFGYGGGDRGRTMSGTSTPGPPNPANEEYRNKVAASNNAHRKFSEYNKWANENKIAYNQRLHFEDFYKAELTGQTITWGFSAAPYGGAGPYGGGGGYGGGGYDSGSLGAYNPPTGFGKQFGGTGYTAAFGPSPGFMGQGPSGRTHYGTGAPRPTYVDQYPGIIPGPPAPRPPGPPQPGLPTGHSLGVTAPGPPAPTGAQVDSLVTTGNAQVAASEEVGLQVRGLRDDNRAMVTELQLLRRDIANSAVTAGTGVRAAGGI